MLAIQPVSFKTYSRPVFGDKYGDDLEGNRAFFEDQKAEIDGLMDDDRLPNGMKKGLKAVSVITDGIIAGISVACATIAGAKWSKGAFSRISKSNFAHNFGENVKPLKDFLTKKSEVVKDFITNEMKKLSETKLGKRAVELYDAFASTKFGKKTIEISKDVYAKTAKFIKGLNIFKTEESYDKATKKTATVLGAGSGVASAYATAVKESEMSEAEE